MIFNYENSYGQFFIDFSKNRDEMLEKIRKYLPEEKPDTMGFCIVLTNEKDENAPFIFLNLVDIAGNDFIVEHESGHCALRLMEEKDIAFKRFKVFDRAKEEDFLWLQAGVAANVYEAMLHYADGAKDSP